MLSLPDFKAKKWVIINTLEGQKMSIQNDNVLVKNKEDETVLQLTCYRIFSIWIIGTTTLTTVLMDRSKKFGFSIVLLNQSFKINGVWNAPTEGNVILRRKQYEYFSIDIAKYLIDLKTENQLSLLKSIRGKSESLKIDISKIKELQLSISEVNENNSLLGLEGVAAKLFFKHWYLELNWKGRKPRTKIDPVNCLLDIGYTILFNFIDSLLNLYGFDTYVGVYHTEFYQRKSLVCDLVEPFRCIIDKQVVKSFGLKQISNDDFELIKGQYRLNFNKNKVVQKFFAEAINENREQLFTFIKDYYRAFMREKQFSDYPIFKIS